MFTESKISASFVELELFFIGNDNSDFASKKFTVVI